MASRLRLAFLPLLLVATLGASPQDLNDAGKAAYARGDYAAAERLFAQAIGQAPREPLLHYHRGAALTALGRFREAASAYEAALRLEPPPAVARAAREGLRALAPALRPLAAPAPGPPEGTAPITRGPGGWMTEVVLNGRYTGRFLVDTGASVTVLSPEMARVLGLPIDADAPRMQLETISGRTTGPALTLPSVRVGDVEARGVQAVVHPTPGMDGILGNTFLSRYSVTLDPERALLTLRPR